MIPNFGVEHPLISWFDVHQGTRVPGLGQSARPSSVPQKLGNCCSRWCPAFWDGPGVAHQEMGKPWKTSQIPSGNLTVCYGKSLFFMDNFHSKWPFSIAFCMLTRGYLMVLDEFDHAFPHWNDAQQSRDNYPRTLQYCQLSQVNACKSKWFFTEMFVRCSLRKKTRQPRSVLVLLSFTEMKHQPRQGSDS